MCFLLNFPATAKIKSYGDNLHNYCTCIIAKQTPHMFSQNPATNTENSAQSRSEHIFMELTLFVYNINSQCSCIKSGLNYLRYKRYKRNETEGNIFFCNLNFHRNGIYILYIDCYHHRKIYILHWLVVSLYIEHFWTIIYHIYLIHLNHIFMRFSASLDLSSVFIKQTYIYIFV